MTNYEKALLHYAVTLHGLSLEAEKIMDLTDSNVTKVARMALGRARLLGSTVSRKEDVNWSR